MAASLISQFIKPANFKIYDEQYGITVWADLRIDRVTIDTQANTSHNPISTEYVANGTQTSDALAADLLATKVLQPVKVVAETFVESISTVLAVIVAFQVVAKTFRITSKGLRAEGMAITDIEIDQSTEMLSAVSLKLTFEQAEITDTTGYNPSQSGDSSTYGISVQADTSVAGELQTVYNKVSSLWS